MIEDIDKIDLNSIVSQALCASIDQQDQDNALSADREYLFDTFLYHGC